MDQEKSTEERKQVLAKNRPSEKRAKIKAKGAAPIFSGPITIEHVIPELDGGTYACKCVAGESFTVQADIFKESNDVLAACIKYRKVSDTHWKEISMEFQGNDHWSGTFTPVENTLYEYTLESWKDPLLSWLNHTEKNCRNFLLVEHDVLEGVELLHRLANRARMKTKDRIHRLIQSLELSRGISEEVLRLIELPEFRAMVAAFPLKDHVTPYEKTLRLRVDRKRAEYGAWYELFPRSQGAKKGKSGTFKDCLKRLPDIKRMGFDIVYLTPFHPIGVTNRKGPNHSLKSDDSSPGSPWAIGSPEGGHKAIHPELGTMKDFKNFLDAASDYGIEIAMDLAFHCSSDHPYVREHPEWFHHLPDGSIRYAENPPVRHEDIYPFNFYCDEWRNLWTELKSIVTFWIEKGVKMFRADNPHTKPHSFWKWLIDDIQREHPDVIFLSAAFTRPKMMKHLAKAGFTQSYTYFTWRNSKWELMQYLDELMQSEMKHYFRGNFFANTPDILSEFLQKGGRNAFQIRFVLAALLSSTYGIYSGFELCENQAKETMSEEYAHSEKYEIKPRDWDRPGHLKEFIGRVNQIRSQNPALQQYRNLRFFHSNTDSILCFGKWTPDHSNIIVAVVNLDPYHVREDTVSLPIWEFGIQGWQTYQMKDLLTGEKYYWRGEHHYVRLDPHIEPAHLFLLKK